MTYEAIVTKYHGAANTRGSRVSATWGADRITIPYDDTDGPGLPAHRKAAEAICHKCGHARMVDRLVGGRLADGRYVFVVAP